jgi:hypothetical protein
MTMDDDFVRGKERPASWTIAGGLFDWIKSYHLLIPFVLGVAKIGGS